MIMYKIDQRGVELRGAVMDTRVFLSGVENSTIPLCDHLPHTNHTHPCSRLRTTQKKESVAAFVLEFGASLALQRGPCLDSCHSRHNKQSNMVSPVYYYVPNLIGKLEIKSLTPVLVPILARVRQRSCLNNPHRILQSDLCDRWFLFYMGGPLCVLYLIFSQCTPRYG